MKFKLAIISIVICLVTAQEYETEEEQFEQQNRRFSAPSRIRPDYSGPVVEKATPVPILKQINQHNEDGSYTYGYEAADGSFKIETKLVTGEVKGKYGYIDTDGKVRTVEYGADRYGFQPSGTDITVPPPTLVDETIRDDLEKIKQRPQISKSKKMKINVPQVKYVEQEQYENSQPFRINVEEPSRQEFSQENIAYSRIQPSKKPAKVATSISSATPKPFVLPEYQTAPPQFSPQPVVRFQQKDPNVYNPNFDFYERPAAPKPQISIPRHSPQPRLKNVAPTPIAYFTITADPNLRQNSRFNKPESRFSFDDLVAEYSLQ